MADKTTKEKSSKLLITIIVSVTLVILAAIAGWVYIQKQELAQRDRELQQQKQLTEYEQQQINNRAEEERTNDRLKSNSNCENWFSGC